MSEDYREFEEQLRLQNSQADAPSSKTRVDPDGTIMEWDEKRKAWFPKIDDDFIARYQMSYGIMTPDSYNTQQPVSTECANGGSVAADWGNFNARLAQLRAEKGEDSDEVKSFMKAAHDSLTAYYDSPAYREWYESYCKHQAELAQQAVAKTTPSTAQQPRKTRHDLKPSDRMRNALVDDGEDPDVALARAEAEQLAGVPIQADPETTAENDAVNTMDSGNAVSETDTKPPAKRKTTTPAPAWYEISDDKNTHVYVTGLPPTITESDFHDLMSKYGVIMNEPFTDRPRIKLYLDDNGKPKGDGRCCYVKVESVELALKLLEGMEYTPGYQVHVERAKFTPKGQFDPKKRRRLTLKEKKKLKEQQESLFRWGIDTSKFVRSKKERVLVLKNAFVESDFATDVTLIPLVRDRLRAQCAKCGTVKKIVVHDANPLGVVTVTFSTPEEADTAFGFLNKALFNYPGPGGVRQLIVERWDGKTNYSLKEDQSEEQSRIQNWEEYLGGGSSSDEETVAKEQAEEELSTMNFPTTAHGPLPDYWEASSPESRQDTDEAGGSSGDETS